MTEREKDLLADLLTTPPEDIDETLHEVQQAHIHSQPDVLTPRDEQALLRAANAVGPVTLTSDQTTAQEHAGTLFNDVSDFVRRYPIPTALAVAGAAYVLMRRRK